MKVALTGHRPQRLSLPEDEKDEKWKAIEYWLNGILIGFSDAEETDIYCGMATGSDIALALTTIYARSVEKINNLKLHCVLPCKDYNSSHPYYKEIKNISDEWIELADEFYKGCDNVRDQYMVDHCDVLLAVWDGIKSGGVWSTIRKAQKAGKQIIYCPKEVLENK